MKTWVLTSILIYLVIGTILALLSRKEGKTKDPEEYFLAKRGLSGIISMLTYSATTYSAFMMIGLVGLTYKAGVGSLGFELTYLAGLVLIAWLGPKFWRVGKALGVISPAEMLGKRYESKRVAIAFAVVSLVFLIPYSAVQIMGIGYSLEVMTKGVISFEIGIILATAVAIVWSFTGGMRSVAWTDSLQAGIMLVSSLIALLFIVYKGFGGFLNLFSRLEAQYPEYLSVPGPGFFKLSTFIGLTTPWFFFSISNPQVSQRLFVPKSLKALKNMLRGFLIFGFIYTIIVVLWGLSARVLIPSLDKADMATPYLLSLPIVPTPVSILVMIGILSAAISTIDSILLTLSSMISKDIFGKFSNEIQILVGKASIFLLALITLIFAYFKPSMIVLLSVSSSAGLLAVVPSIIGAFYWEKSSESGAFWSITFGALITGILFLKGAKPLGLMPGIWSIIISLGIFTIFSIVSPSGRGKNLEIWNI